jgi:iron(III) transport system substrate-binding protein
VISKFQANKRFPIIGLVVLCFSFSVFPAALEAGSQWESSAKKEQGSLVWYTSLNVTTSRPMADRFEEKYPFLKVSVYRASAEGILNRVMTEEKAGRSSFDVISSQAVFYFQEKGLLTPYRSPETGALVNSFYDPDGFWASLFANRFAVGYNTAIVPPEKAPKNWQDLLDPWWRGKIGIDTEEFLWYGAMIKYFGKEKGLKFMKKLAGQDIQWRKGHTLIAQMIAAGEFPGGIIYTHRIDDMREKGAPLQWVRTADPIVVAMSGMGISKKTDSPASSRLFIDFALSSEGQSMIKKSGRTSGRKDMQQEDEGVKMFTIPPEVLVNANVYAREFNEIFRPGK